MSAREVVGVVEVRWIDDDVGVGGAGDEAVARWVLARVVFTAAVREAMRVVAGLSCLTAGGSGGRTSFPAAVAVNGAEGAEAVVAVRGVFF